MFLRIEKSLAASIAVVVGYIFLALTVYVCAAGLLVTLLR